MVYMLWEKCIPSTFYKYICQKENFMSLNGLGIAYYKTKGKVNKFVMKGNSAILLILKISFNLPIGIKRTFC